MSLIGFWILFLPCKWVYFISWVYESSMSLCKFLSLTALITPTPCIAACNFSLLCKVRTAAACTPLFSFLLILVLKSSLPSIIFSLYTLFCRASTEDAHKKILGIVFFIVRKAHLRIRKWGWETKDARRYRDSCNCNYFQEKRKLSINH